MQIKYSLSLTVLFLFSINVCHANEFLEQLKKDGSVSLDGGSTTYIFKDDGTFQGFPSKPSSIPYGLTIEGVWFQSWPLVIYGKWNLYNNPGGNKINYKRMRLLVSPISIENEGNYKFYFIHDELTEIPMEEYLIYKENVGYSRYKRVKSYFNISNDKAELIPFKEREPILINNFKFIKDRILNHINDQKKKCGVIEVWGALSDKGNWGNQNKYNQYINVIDIVEVDPFDIDEEDCELNMNNFVKNGRLCWNDPNNC